MSDWLVDGLIPEGQIILVVGKPGNLKSWWVAQLAVDVAEGKKHLDKFEVKPSNVIYIDEDTESDVFNERLERLSHFGNPLSILPIDRRSMQGFRLSESSDRLSLVTDIKKLVSQGEHVLVIIDSLIKVMAGKNMDTTKQGSEVMSYLTEIRDAGATVVVVHHMSLKKEPKEHVWEMWDPMSLVLNSTMIVAGSDTAFAVVRVPIEDPTMFVIKPQARRVALKVKRAFAVELIEDEKHTYAMLSMLDEIPRLPSEDAKLIFQLFPDFIDKLTVKDIDSKLQEDLPKSRIRVALDELVKEGCLVKSVDPHSKNHAVQYMLNPNFKNLNSFYITHI